VAAISAYPMSGLTLSLPDVSSLPTSGSLPIEVTRISRERELAYLLNMYLRPKFQKAQKDLNDMSDLSWNWDTYGADPPAPQTINQALELLVHLEQRSFAPTRVVPSAEGGVAVLFTRGDRYADIEFLNTGEVLAVTYAGKAEPDVWEIAQEPLEPTVERIRNHLAS
jgi:hypothetical protein